MRIMIHSNGPMVPSGYGSQVRLLGREMIAAGHQVGVSAFAGLSGSAIEHQGMFVMPSGQQPFGVDTIIPHATHWAADLTIALMDFWQLSPIAEHLRELNLAAWLPIDSEPMGWMDRGALQQSAAFPLAMSRFGLEQLHAAGFTNAVYIPHSVDTEEYAPLPAETRAAYRAGMGMEGRFVIGIVAANNDHLRKGFAEQFEAFRRFHKRHPEALLLVHTIPDSGRGIPLRRMAQQMGLADGSYKFSDTYAQISGLFDQSLMSDFYNVLDVLSACALAEGFGLPMVEAQACGTPVISTRGSTMTELRGKGWGVAGHPFWNHTHGGWWQTPDVDGIVRAYEKAHQWASTKREVAREFALEYDTRTVYKRHWAPFLTSVEEGLAEGAARARAAAVEA